MALYETQTIVLTGVTPTKNAVSASDTFVNNGRTFIHIVNGNAGSTTASFVSSDTQDGLAIDDLDIVVAAGTEKVVGPFPTNTFGTLVTVTYTVTATVTAQRYSLAPVR